MSTNFRFNRPQDLSLVAKPSLSVAVVIACKDGQKKLDLVLIRDINDCIKYCPSNYY